ncbi:aldose epimerase family protein [Flavitalea antarctica]
MEIEKNGSSQLQTPMEIEKNGSSQLETLMEIEKRRSSQFQTAMEIEKICWGENSNGTAWLYTIKSERIEIDVTNYGCTIVAIRVNGRNVILGYSGFAELSADKYYVGCIVGRFAGRISGSSFVIGGDDYRLPANDGTSGNHLHGGVKGFNRMMFREVAVKPGDHAASVAFAGLSEHLDQGYPGNVDITFTLTLTDDNEILLDYLAVPDRPTHINLTHHLYYNLCDPKPGTAQELTINADLIAETGEDYIPTGRIIAVPEYADFSTSRPISRNINYSEYYVLKERQGADVMKEGRETAEGVKVRVENSEAMREGRENVEGEKVGEEIAEGIKEESKTLEAMREGRESVEALKKEMESDEALRGRREVVELLVEGSETSRGTEVAQSTLMVDAILADSSSGGRGLTMELSTTCPAIIFYSGQFLGPPFYPKQGICLETQYLPDSPNQKNFPSTLYTPEKKFREQTRLRFKHII